jgi:hypothetical protein
MWNVGSSKTYLRLHDSERSKAIADPLQRQAYGRPAHSGLQRIVVMNEVDEG